ncbi:MAG: TylF/MycF/NovP-related O-methyltransferase [Minisyncoccia bacterium]
MITRLLRKMIPESILPKLRLLSYAIRDKFTYTEDCLYTTVNVNFLNEPTFANAYTKGKELMQESWDNYDFRWRAYIVAWAAKQMKNLEGDFVECGVNTGMIARMIIDYINFESVNKKYYLLDTYTGMSETYSTEKEMIRSEKMGYTTDIYGMVKNTFAPFENVIIVRGAVPETLSQVPSSKVSLLLIDMNCLLPEIEALEFFWDKMVPGGLIILDDHGFPGHEEQRRGHIDFAARHNTVVLPLPTGQGLIIKQ